MTRPSGTTQPAFTLLPFLSVLIGLMGALMFLALGVALTSLESAASNVEITVQWPSDIVPPRTVTLECTEQGAHEVGSTRRFARAELPALDDTDTLAASAFGAYLKYLEESGPVYVLFVVRPDGLDTFKQLRALAVLRIREASVRKIPLTELPNDVLYSQLPAKLKSKIAYGDGLLHMHGTLTALERDQLKDTLATAASRDAIDHLYEQIRSGRPPIEYGVELLPADWHLSGATPSSVPSEA